MRLDASQEAAITQATARRTSIITGGAGTGKTTIIKTITERLEKKGENVVLAAFAGKAAARLREACKHPASTIHRLLGYNGKVFLTPDLSGTTLIIDESSMIDSVLLSEIVRRNPKRLCLVGDPAQLAPVGRGQPFHDLIDYRPDLVKSLTTCYRATEAVYQAASRIREGGRPPVAAASDNETWSMINTGGAKRTQDQVIQWVKDGSIDFEQDVILCGRNGSDKEPCTVKGMNAAIVDAISPRTGQDKFKVDDRVINTKNLPESDVWNGTTGTIHAIDVDGGIWVRTDIPVIDWSKTKDEKKPTYTNHVLFGKSTKKHLQLAYALTVHKAQGSQYRNVMVVCLNKDNHSVLDRSWLYTSVTRTKSACCVVGELSSVWTAVDKVNHKRTIIQQLAEVA